MRACAEIDLAALRSNVAKIRERAGTSRVMAVVKADAYGHGLVPCARAAISGGAQWLGVALLEEAVAIRSAGIKARTIAWLVPPKSDLDLAIREDIDLSIPSREHLFDVIASGRNVGVVPRVHLEIDTGMSRGGVLKDFKELVTALKSASDRSQIEVVGVWSHFARADEPGEAMNLDQLAKYREALDHLLVSGFEVKMQHMANSAAIFNDSLTSLARFDMVRGGIATYGLSPDLKMMGDSKSLGLKPVMTLKAQLQLVKEVPAGSSVGYGGTYTVKSDTKLGVIAMGYGDGIPRSSDDRAGVFVDGKRAPIAGRVSMDQFVVDLGIDSTAKSGDLVTVFGDGSTGEYTADDWALASGTINYEIVTRIGPRVPRIHLHHESDNS